MLFASRSRSSTSAPRLVGRAPSALGQREWVTAVCWCRLASHYTFATARIRCSAACSQGCNARSSALNQRQPPSSTHKSSAAVASLHAHS